MTAYLHRLAASGRSSGGAIHPLLPPMFSSGMPEVADEERSEASIWGAPVSPRRSEPQEILPLAPVRTAQPDASPTAVTPLHGDPMPRPPDRPRVWPPRPQDRLVASSHDDLRPERAAFAALVDDGPLASPAVGERASFLANTRRGRDETATRASRRTSNEADEVHIHIGRIEVTAVQAAPPHPPSSKPRRTAVSLDEYLRRRNGGAS